MTRLDEAALHMDLLRRRAEDALRGKIVDPEGLQVQDFQSILHELQVHQVELSMQIDELHRVQQELEISRDLYSDLYDFAPIGYCTLNQKDRILEANQTLSTLLGVEHGKLIHTQLSHFVDRADQDLYYLYRQNAFADHHHAVGEIHFVRQSGESILIRLESEMVRVDANQLRIMLSDITELRRLQKEAQEVQHRLMNQTEQERQKIARDLHDGPLQVLISLIFDMEGIFMDDEFTPEITEHLKAVQNSLKIQIDELRTYAGELRPPVLMKFGLGKAIRSHIDLFQEKHPELHLTFEDQQDGELLLEETALALYRIYQEALVNILKHAQATEIIIHLLKNKNQMVLEIQDNGVGFTVPKEWLELARQAHLGLVGMRERAEAVGGQLEVSSHPGQGTLIRATVPLM